MATNPVFVKPTSASSAPALPGEPRTQRWMGRLTLIVISLIGVVAFVGPFVTASLPQTSEAQARMGEGPLFTIILAVACLLVTFLNLGPALSSKSIALLGVLLGINIVLRIFDLSFLPPGEFSPIFILVILVGYVFGAQLGFLMGALTMLSSALFTGGIGPWLPFQMFTTGWIGMTAGWLRYNEAATGVTAREIVKLAVFGAVWGLLYGLIINLYFWPFLAAGTAQGSATNWTPGLSLRESVTRYGAFYLLTSLGPDLSRAAGNIILLLTLGGPLLKVFRRFRARFAFVAIQHSSDGAQGTS